MTRISRSRHQNILIAILATGLSLLLCEVLVRCFFPSTLYRDFSERGTLYQYDRELGWFPIPNLRSHFKDLRDIQISHNRYGFRGPDSPARTRPRIAFLGDSFVYGYNVEAGERFTERLARRLPGHEILNWGVSGYGTDQEFLLLERDFRIFKPDLVFLIFCAENDPDDNTHNFVYEGYFKPYFEIDHQGLQLKGVPAPQSGVCFYRAHPFLFKSALVRRLAEFYLRRRRPPSIQVADPTQRLFLATRSFVEAHQARLFIGFTDSMPALEAFCKTHGIDSINLANPYRYADGGPHWTPEGHEWVAEKLYAFLRAHGVS